MALELVSKQTQTIELTSGGSSSAPWKILYEAVSDARVPLPVLELFRGLARERRLSAQISHSFPCGRATLSVPQIPKLTMLPSCKHHIDHFLLYVLMVQEPSRCHDKRRTLVARAAAAALLPQILRFALKQAL
jgi:hypothetical protein